MPYFWRSTTAERMDAIAAALEKYANSHARYPAGGIQELKSALYPDYTDGKSYTLVCAGSDKVFRPETWTTSGTFEGDAEDAVIKDGKHVRDWKLLK